MRVECPSCAARYDVPDDRITPGRTLQCGKCAAEWSIGPPRPPPAARPHPMLRQGPTTEPVEAPPPPEPPAEPVPVASTRGRGPALPLAWIASIAALAGAGWLIMAHQGDIEGAWPASGRLFAWLRNG